jgi:hypothetical protein
MTSLFSYSKGSLSQRRPNAGAYAFPGTNFLFALSPEDGEKRSFSSDTFIVDGNTYEDRLGWSIGDSVEIHQWCDPSDADGIRLSGWVKAPDMAPIGTVWVFSIIQFDAGMNYKVQYRCELWKKLYDLSDVLIPTNQIGNFPGFLIFSLQLEAL